jgi:hypothetical protein
MERMVYQPYMLHIAIGNMPISMFTSHMYTMARFPLLSNFVVHDFRYIDRNGQQLPLYCVLVAFILVKEPNLTSLLLLEN